MSNNVEGKAKKPATEQVLTPKLRFPEFRDVEAWEEVTLGDYFDPIRNGFVGTATPYYTTSGGVRYLQGRNIKEGKIEGDSLIFITEDFHNQQQKSHLKSSDILMVQSGHVGECALVGVDFAGSNCHALIILTPKRTLSSEFFIQYFYSPIGETAILQITTGNTIKHILASELKTLTVLVPGLAEQRKIADCLSSLGEVIAAQTQKLELLKLHKKGLMQQLFPAESEILPKLRFPEFQDAGEWEKKSLSQFFEFRNGLNAEKEKYGKGHKYISVLDIISDKPITYDSIISKVEATDKDLNNFKVEYGDILFQRSSETKEEAGQANVYIDTEKPAVFGGFVIRGKKIADYDPLFMKALLASSHVRKEITSRSAGSTRYNVGQDTLSAITVSFPSFPEQQKIADSLSSLEELIGAQTQKLELLKVHKKGLMQQLFPALDEVNA